jgi:hypothetical protein
MERKTESALVNKASQQALHEVVLPWFSLAPHFGNIPCPWALPILKQEVNVKS